MSREAMSRALAALEKMDDELYSLECYAPLGVAIDDLRAALAQPSDSVEQEPVVTKNEKGLTLHVGWDDLPAGTKLYTSPPQRQPLPAHEIVTMYDESPTSDSDMIAFARAIEAAHGIKP